MATEYYFDCDECGAENEVDTDEYKEVILDNLTDAEMLGLVELCLI